MVICQTKLCCGCANQTNKYVQTITNSLHLKSITALPIYIWSTKLESIAELSI